MRNIYLTFLSVVLILSSPCVAFAIVHVKEQPNVVLEQPYENKEKNYSISYPSNWHKKEMPKLDLVLFAPPKAAAKEPEASMNVVSEKVDAGVSLDLFYNESITNLSKALKEVKIIKSEMTQLNGIPSKWVKYTHVLNDNKFEVLQYFIVGKEMVYLLTFSAIADNFAEYLPVFERTAASFKLLEAP